MKGSGHTDDEAEVAQRYVWIYSNWIPEYLNVLFAHTWIACGRREQNEEGHKR
jgi:hypothetical protein